MKLYCKAICILLALVSVWGAPSCKRSVFIPETSVNPEPPDDPGVYEEGFYVTVKGAGMFTGEDWDNAMSAQNLKDLLLADANGNFSAEKAARINGKIIHLEQGIYAFGSSDRQTPVISGKTAAFSVTLKGGYKNGGYTQYPDKYHTYLSGSSDYRIFLLKGNAKVTLDGVGLTGARGQEGGQAAAQVHEGELVLNRCDICNNYNSATTGGIQVAYGGIVRATACRFFDNVASNGGAVNVEGETSCCYLTDCEFFDNSAGNYGGALKVSTGTMKVTGCLFRNNHAEGRGGAIWVNGCKDEQSVVFERCRFIGNSSTADGGVCYHTNSSTANYKACEFTDNAGLVAGVVMLDGGGALEVGFDQCVFRGCYASNNCSVFYNAASNGRLYFNACLFKDNSCNGKYGAIGRTWSNCFVGMNNCSIADTRLTLKGANSQQACWFDLSYCKFLFANSSIIGVPTVGEEGLPTYGLVRLNSNDSNVCFINNIIASTLPNGCGIYGGDTQTSLTLTGCYNKMSPTRTQKAGTFTYDPGDGDDLKAYASSFPGLAWNANGWVWNGDYAGTEPMGSTTTIHNAIQFFDADFYAWLSGIGALGKDIRGNDRGAISWPGSYQN